MDKTKILIVEDEAIVAQDLASILKAMGYIVCGVVSSGEEAIQKALHAPPNLVLMDVVLKGKMDGVAAANEVRTRLGIPVVFVTAYADEKTLQRAKISGPFGYLLKPFEERELQGTIEVALYRHEMEEKLRKFAEEWETTFNSIQDWVSIHNLDFRIIRANKRLSEAFRMSLGEMISSHCYEILHCSGEPISRCPHQRTLQTRQPAKEEIFEPHMGKYLEISVWPIFNGRGELTGTVHITKDISERKRAEEALMQSEERYRSILDNIEEGYFEVDIAGNFNFFNDSLCRELGYSKEEMLGMNNRQYMSKETAKEVYQVFNLVYTTGEPCRGNDWEIIRKDGTKRIHESSLALIRNANSEPIGFRGITRDVTERRAVEEALRQSEEEARRYAQENAIMAEIGRIISSTLNVEEVYEHFAQEVQKLICVERLAFTVINSEDHTAITDYAWGIEIPNRLPGMVFPLAGTATEKVVQANSGLIIPTEDEDEVAAQIPGLLPVFRAGIRSTMMVPLIYRDEVIGVLNLQSIKPKAFTEKELRIAERIGNQIAGAVANSRLFIKLKQAEEQLRRSEERFRLLIENSSDTIATVGQDQNFSYISPSIKRMLGYESAQYLGRNAFQLIHPDDLKSSMEAFKQVLQNPGNSVSIEHRLKHQGGSWRVFQTVGRCILNESGEYQIILNSRDLTQQKNLESQLAQAQKLEAIGSLAAGIAHEINTPTQYVGDNTRFFKDAFSDLNRLLEKYEELLQEVKAGGPTDEVVQEIAAITEEIDLAYIKEEVPKAIEQTLEGVGRVTKIVQAMKEFSHPGTKEKTFIDINKAIENTITVARNEWKYVAEMVTDLDPSLPLVKCLPDEFNQVILNMIINAAHAIGDVVGDGSEKKGIIKVITRKDGDFAEIRISDTGTGIPENIRSRIFDPFFTTKKVGRGTGQGLTISHSVIVEKHGGTISFDSDVGRGTTFIIRLPIENGEGHKD
jgi:PAS domain S-box-containing protein